MTSAIDGKVTTAWGIDAGPGRRNQSRKAVFVGDKPVLFSAGMRLKIELSQNHGGWNSDDLQSHNLGRFRISVTPTTEVVADPLPAGIRHCIENIPRDQRTSAQVGAIFSYWRTLKPEFKEANARLEALWKQWPDGTPLLIFLAVPAAVRVKNGSLLASLSGVTDSNRITKLSLAHLPFCIPCPRMLMILVCL